MTSRRRFDSIYLQIRRDVSHGRLQPGDKLPPERDLAEQLGVGRPILREALRSLEATGILEFRKGITGGAFVCEGNPNLITRAISDLLFLGAVSLENIAEVRFELLCAAARLACVRGTEEEFDAIERNLDETLAIAKLGVAADTIHAIGEFYGLLGKAAHNDGMTMMIMSVTEVIAQILIKFMPGFVEELVEARRRVLDQLRKRDPVGTTREIGDHLTMIHGYVLAKAKSIHALELEPINPSSS